MYTSGEFVGTCTQVVSLFEHVHKWRVCLNMYTSVKFVRTCTQVLSLLEHVHKW